MESTEETETTESHRGAEKRRRHFSLCAFLRCSVSLCNTVSSVGSVLASKPELQRNASGRSVEPVVQNVGGTSDSVASIPVNRNSTRDLHDQRELRFDDKELIVQPHAKRRRDARLTTRLGSIARVHSARAAAEPHPLDIGAERRRPDANEIDEVGDGRVAFDRARSCAFDLLILDVMLPGLDGMSLCQAVRSEGPNTETPILMLTARDGESDKVMGLESGADDYVTKPFGVRELLARIRAILRRSQRTEGRGASSHQRRVVSNAVVLDVERRETVVRGQLVELTRQEFDLLYQLAVHPGIVFSRASLLQHVWSRDTFVTERTVDIVISRLRRKVERDPQDPELILTAWGVGYKFVDVG